MYNLVIFLFVAGWLTLAYFTYQRIKDPFWGMSEKEKRLHYLLHSNWGDWDWRKNCPPEIYWEKLKEDAEMYAVRSFKYTMLGQMYDKNPLLRERLTPKEKKWWDKV